VPESFCSHAEEIARHLNIGRCHVFQAVASDHTHLRIHNGFRCEAIVRAVLQPKHVVRKVEGANLTSAIGQNFKGSDRPVGYLEDSVCRLALAVNLYVLCIGSLRRSELGMNCDDCGFLGRIVGDGHTPFAQLSKAASATKVWQAIVDRRTQTRGEKATALGS
jgi:hypothetical protein